MTLPTTDNALNLNAVQSNPWHFHTQHRRLPRITAHTLSAARKTRKVMRYHTP